MSQISRTGAGIPLSAAPRRSRQRLKETLYGYLFIGPMFLGVFVFTVLPILAVIALSITDWSFIAGLDKIKWNGLDNFERLFRDPIFLKSLQNNFYLLVTIPVTMILSLLLAIVLNKHVFLKDLFKVVFFMPYISSIVAVAIVYQVLFHPSYGPVNQALISLGVGNPPKWLADTHYALISVMMIQVWVSIGFYLIIYLAGLQNIPKDLYESADIDGANAWHKFRSITVPLLSPTSFFLLVTGVIYSFRIFDLIAVLTAGGPAGSTSVIVYYLYDSAFNNLKTGYASSMAVVLLILTLAITGLQWLAQKKWVNYQ
ncbi:carbohydrate ABC transporter permease [Cohnella caldifontis]|uniref:carbohydrate ABC transporter permease n=1 Tax=Cohnella caldifontis TaxID=3027471 RepID=UPI0023EC8944|nr:sugar ABC transporter permease [Cohnella sp. YIM B05605]